MANESDGQNGVANPERAAEIRKLIDETAEKVMRPPAGGFASALTTPAQREAGFERLADVLPTAVQCRICGQRTARVVNGVCGVCFVAGAEARTNPAEHARDAAPAPSGPVCSFCGRRKSELAEHEGMVGGQTPDAVICSACVFNIAGVVGAKSAADARAMLAQAGLQAIATKECIEMLKRAGEAAAAAIQRMPAEVSEFEGRAAAAASLASAAEAMARIAIGRGA